MSLDQKDIEIIERIIYKNADDIAVSIARSFERLEERIDSAESRLYTRMADIEDRIEGVRENLSNYMGDEAREIKDAIDELAKFVHNNIDTREVKADTIKMYSHKTDGGAEYLFDTFIKTKNGHNEGVINDKTKYVVRLDGNPELTIK